MKRITAPFAALASLALCFPAAAQEGPPSSGVWRMELRENGGSPQVRTLEMSVQADRFSGRYEGGRAQGRPNGSRFSGWFIDGQPPMLMLRQDDRQYRALYAARWAGPGHWTGVEIDNSQTTGQFDLYTSPPAPAAAPPSCAAIHAASPGAPTGRYTIDPDGTGAGAPFEVFCDMATAGGGWTLAYDDRNTFQITQRINPAVMNMPIRRMLVIASDGRSSVVPAHPSVSSLAQAFAQPWQPTGSADGDRYKPLGADTGDRTTTLYIFDDNDIGGGPHVSCTGWQHDYPTTPNGIISYGYSSGDDFGDGGACDYSAYGGRIYTRALLVK